MPIALVVARCSYAFLALSSKNVSSTCVTLSDDKWRDLDIACTIAA